MKVIIIGGGAAGMMAAYQAAKCGNDVSLYEKNEKLGKKIFITGKGRCNVTNACEIEELLDHVVTNKEFLYSGFYSFTNDAMMEFLEELGCPLKVERGNRVFPVSDHSSDVIAALQRGLRKENVDIYFNTTVKKILIEDGIVTGVRLASGDTVKADKVVVATGGMSYQATGSTGDGYDFARKAGHKVTKLTPALVPFEIKEDYCKQLMGLSLRNVAVIMIADGKKIYEDFGAKQAKGDYLLLLNNDMEVISRDWLTELLSTCQRKEVGAVGARLYYPDDTVQHAGIISILTIFGIPLVILIYGFMRWWKRRKA